MNYIIRKTQIKDMDSVMDAHRRSIRELCINDYKQDQIDKWSDINYSQDIWSRSINDEYHTVVVVDGKIEGLCHAKVHGNNEGSIVGLYLTPVIHGLGIGREVFEMAMKYLESFLFLKMLIS